MENMKKDMIPEQSLAETQKKLKRIKKRLKELEKKHELSDDEFIILYKKMKWKTQ